MVIDIEESEKRRVHSDASSSISSSGSSSSWLASRSSSISSMSSTPPLSSSAIRNTSARALHLTPAPNSSSSSSSSYAPSHALSSSSSHASHRPTTPTASNSDSSTFLETVKEFLHFAGPGFFVSIGYMDPGNWSVDLQGGSTYGYSLLWVLLLSNLMAVLLQALMTKFTIQTGLDLAQACKAAYPRRVSLTLWALAEVAIMATDLAEVLGSAMALNILFGLDMLVGVLLTSFDTLLLLLMQSAKQRKFEYIVFLLLGSVFVCFVAEMIMASPPAVPVLKGFFIPSIPPGSLILICGMIGATVMPHNIYLHGGMLVTRLQQEQQQQSTAPSDGDCSVSSPPPSSALSSLSSKVKAKLLKYAYIDSFVALNAALFVNAAITILAASSLSATPVERIQDAPALLHAALGTKLAPIFFGVALFCSGQSSTVTGTLAGAIVMEGFLSLRLKPWIRRMVTRCIAIVPAVCVIALFSDEGSFQLLIFSQVVLSLQLPFVIIPLIKLTDTSRILGPNFKNHWLTSLLAWCSSLLILGLNGWLVYGFVEQLFDSENSSLRMFGYLFMIPLCVFLLLFSLYIIWKPVSLHESYLQVSSVVASPNLVDSNSNDEEEEDEEQDNFASSNRRNDGNEIEMSRMENAV